MTDAPSSAVTMSRSVIDSIAKSVSEGGDAAEARRQLADLLRGEASAAEAEKAAPIPAVDAITGEEAYSRPNGEVYFARKFGEHSDVEFVRRAREENLFILAYGEPGTGKTALFDAAFADEGMESIQGSGDTEVADFIGSYVQHPGGEYVWVDGPAVRAAERGVPLYIDEIALIDPKVLAIVYSLMDGRREIVITANPERGTVEVKDGFYIVAACNPNAPGARMSEALVSRFTVQVEMTTDFAMLKSKLGVPSKIITAAQNLQRKREKGEVGWAPQTRELLAYKKTMEVFGEDIALRNLVAVSPEIDRGQVKDVISRTFAKNITGLASS